MTIEKIIELAREAGFAINTLGWTYTQGVLNEHLTKFAALVAAHERERCAQVCEDLQSSRENADNWSITRDLAFHNCVEAIRALKD